MKLMKLFPLICPLATGIILCLSVQTRADGPDHDNAATRAHAPTDDRHAPGSKATVRRTHGFFPNSISSVKREITKRQREDTDERDAADPSKTESDRKSTRATGVRRTGKHSIERTLASKRKTRQQSAVTIPGREANGEPENEKNDFLESYLYYLQLRATPNDSVDWSFWARAADHRDHMPAARLRTTGVTHALAPGIGPKWQFVGPTNLPPPYRQYFGTQVLSGRVNGIAFDPSQAGTYYITTAGGGVWKTFNNGGRWIPLSDTLSWQFQQTGSIALDPKRPATLFVSTSDPFFNGGGQRYIIGYSGIMRTVDGGTTWTKLDTSGFGQTVVHKIVVDPEQPGLVMAVTGWDDPITGATTGLIWRSIDNGNNWKPAFPLQSHWTDIVYSIPDATNSRVYYACAYDAFHGNRLYVSTDRGINWQTATRLPLSTNMQVGIDIAASAVDAKTLYVLAGTDNKVLKSTTNGSSWANLTPNFTTTPYNWSQSNYDYFIGCSTYTNTMGVKSDAVYVGLIDVMQSIDGGATWRSIGGPSYATNSLIHNDQHAWAVNPADPNDMLVGNDGGIFHLFYFPTRDTWSFRSLNATLGITQFYHLDLHPGATPVLLGGSQDNASPATLGSFSNWLDVAGGDGGWAAIDPTDVKTQYAGEANQVKDLTTTPPTAPKEMIVRTVDSWASVNTVQSLSFTPSFEQNGFLSPLMLLPGSPGILYVGVQGLWRWDSSRPTQWIGPLGGAALAGSSAYITALGAGCAGSVIYTGSLDSKLYRSTNPNSSWGQIDGGVFNGRPIIAISVDPSDGNSMLVGLGGTGIAHLWQCSDTSLSSRVWSPVVGTGLTSIPDVQLNTIARDPSDPKHTWYVGTDVGAFMTVDAGATWTNATLPLGLPNVEVTELKPALGTGHLYAATFGRGIWRIPLTGKANYSVIDLDPGAGVKASYANAINHAMQMAGQIRTSAPSYLGRFWPDQNSSVAWGTLPGGSNSVGLAIAGDGSVVGYADDSNGTNHAIIWFPSDHKIHNLETNQGIISQANGISDAGPIVGQRGNHAFIYYRNVLRFDDMNTLGGSSSSAMAINNAQQQQIAGFSGTSSGQTHAFRHDGLSSLIPSDDLGTLGGTFSQGVALNDIGQVVGNSTTMSGQIHAFATSPNQKINPYKDDLGTLGGGTSEALAIDNMGRVVGKSLTATGAQHAFLWDVANGMQDLNNLIPATSGWTLTEARGVVDCGCIVGIGSLNGKTHAFLLKL